MVITSNKVARATQIAHMEDTRNVYTILTQKLEETRDPLENLSIDGKILKEQSGRVWDCMHLAQDMDQ
jgi:hypothetical protein